MKMIGSKRNSKKIWSCIQMFVQIYKCLGTKRFKLTFVKNDKKFERLI